MRISDKQKKEQKRQKERKIRIKDSNVATLTLAARSEQGPDFCFASQNCISASDY
jgi:hypothetical protein